VANNCTSQGADDKLGFANAPDDFCAFNKSSSSLVTGNGEDVYSFASAAGETVNVVVKQNALASVTVSKNAKYSFACGLPNTTPCQNTVFNNQTTFKEFSFTNTVLSAIGDITRTLTLKNGSLIHQLPVVTPPTTASCTGNTNTFGCLTITGANAPAAIFEHSSEQNFVNDGLPVNSLTTSGAGAVVYRHPQKGSFTEDSILKVGVDQKSTYSYQEYDASLTPIKQGAYECTANPTTKLCTNLMHRPATKEFVFDDVVFTKVGSTETLIFTGVVKY
jgi:hypothetical protein